MSDSKGLPVGRLLAEFSVIVIGVLVALLADSAWQARGERAEESAALERIQEELVRDAEGLDLDARFLDLIEAALPLAIDILSEEAEGLTDDQKLVYLFMSAMRRIGADEVRTFDELAASGRLTLISHPETRRWLIGFYAALRNLRENDEGLAEDSYRQTILSVIPGERATEILTGCIAIEVRPGRLVPGTIEGLESCALAPGEPSPGALVRTLIDRPGLLEALRLRAYQINSFRNAWLQADLNLDSLNVRLDQR